MVTGLGIDVGGSKILACAIDGDGRLLSERQVDSPAASDALVRALAKAIADAESSLRETARSIDGVGIGLPGLIDENEVLNETPNIPSAQGLDLRPSLTAALVAEFADRGFSGGSLPRLVFENDATCAGAGEWAFGAAQARSDAIVVTLGTGIGGGLIVNGRVARGARGFAGEIGHMVINPDGPLCACGNHGCWEQYASGTGLARLAREAVAQGQAKRIVELADGKVDKIHGEHVIEAVREKDNDAEMILREFSRYLAVGFSNLIEVLDPACIIVGGGLSRASEFFLDQTRTELAGFRRGSGPRAVEVLVAKLEDRAGACGAAGIAMGVVK